MVILDFLKNKKDMKKLLTLLIGLLVVSCNKYDFEQNREQAYETSFIED